MDFTLANRAELVSRLLELCAVDPTNTLPDGVFRELSVGKRIECLLILAAGGTDTPFGFPFKCTGCGEEIELELMLGEISEIQCEADLVERVSVEVAGRQMELRKPTGRDQEMWGKMIFRNERDAAAGMIGTLTALPRRFEAIQEAIQMDELIAIEEALDEADPLVNFNCRVSCGECGELNEPEIDLMEAAIGILKRVQRQLVVTVHQLASHYHWSEQEIFAIPDWRRRQYLELIGTATK